LGESLLLRGLLDDHGHVVLLFLAILMIGRHGVRWRVKVARRGDPRADWVLRSLRGKKKWSSPKLEMG
jgi:hypothetical protein